MSKTADNPIFKSLDEAGRGRLTLEQVRKALAENGIDTEDSRIRGFLLQLATTAKGNAIDAKTFESLTGSGTTLFERAVRKDLVIPDFPAFREIVEARFNEVGRIEAGAVADYIPQLARIPADRFAVSFCTIDGQGLNLGDASERFTFQSSIKPVLYCAALEESGTAGVHKHVGREPSGLAFNELTLNPRNLPHNPMINAGAIMSSSLIRPEAAMADRFDALSKLVGRLTGGREPGFDNATFHSERATADRNFALAHHMREVGAFPSDTDIFATLDLYFSACSLLTNTRDMAAIAATLANGGVCPLTDEQVFQPETVKNCLSMMYSCGMYDYSGEFAFTVGIPAKSGVSGAILAVIPNVLGIAVWSPSLDEHGNSVRGVRFLEQLVESFNFHNYDNLVQSKKIDPRRNGQGAEFDSTYQAIFAASTGDINELKRLVARGHDLNSADYDGRTPLHLAAAEGKAEAVRYLLDQGVDENPRDRWNNTPADDARRHRKTDVVALLKSGAKAAANARSRNAAPDRKAA
jgi:glutaminase